MEKSFNSLAELQEEIKFLRVQQFQKEEALKEKFSSPSAVFSSVTGLLKTGSGKKSLLHDALGQDTITNIARIILPLFVNGVLFKRSGFITKTLITFLSQKAAKQVNSNVVVGVIDKISAIFKPKPGAAKTKSSRIRDYGIPPDSETY